MKTVFGIIIWIYWAICIITFFFIICFLYLITFPFDGYNRIPNRAVKGLAWIMLNINPGWTFEIRGADLNKITAPTIVVANHQSFMDLSLLYLLPWCMKWVSKKSMFKIPIFGWIIYMTGQLGIDRESTRSVKKLDKLVEPIKKGIPAMIFPEGTRTQTGALKPLKSGAFKLANKYNFNVLPIVLNGGFNAMPPGSWKPEWKQHFVISVLDPVSAVNFKTEQEFKDEVSERMKRELILLQVKTDS